MGSTTRGTQLSYKILVLSDLHLGEPSNDSRYAQFLTLLDNFLASDIQELLFMGDIFDILIGNKRFWKKLHPEFFRKLQKAKDAGKKLTWVQGNHDFQIGKLLEPYGVHWIEEHEVIQRNSYKISLSHGDLADGTNKLHPYWRRFLTSGVLALFIKVVPELVAEKILYPFTLKLSGASRKVSKHKEHIETAREIFRDYALKLHSLHGADLVILGHSHISDKHPLTAKATYLNLGSWFESPQVGLIELDSKKIDLKVSPLSSWLP